MYRNVGANDYDKNTSARPSHRSKLLMIERGRQSELGTLFLHDLKVLALELIQQGYELKLEEKGPSFR